MSTKRLTKLAGIGLSGLLIASFIVMSAGLLFVLAPGNPVSADNGPVVTRHLPPTVVPGETFEVTVTFTTDADAFNSILLTDLAPTGWHVSVHRTWCTPEANAVSATDNKAEITWFGSGDPDDPDYYFSGTAFTARYRVTVPDGALPGTYTFPNTDQFLRYYVGPTGPNYVHDFEGPDEVEITKPDEVWVNEAWTGSSAGDIVDGRVFGYNAFATIQDGIGGVAGSTVHVLEGEYDGFIVEDRNNLTIIGYDAVVTGALYMQDFHVHVMGRVVDSTNIAISGLDFDGSGIGEVDAVIGIFYLGSTGSIDGLEVREVYGTEIGIGIVAIGGVMATVSISDTDVTDCPIGVYVVFEHVNLTGCRITTSETYGGIGIYAIAAVVNIDDCEISGFQTDDVPQGEPLSLPGSPLEDLPQITQWGPGIGVGSVESHVTLTGCSQILNNDYGIYVGGGYVEVTGCGIWDNNLFGVYNEGGGSQVNAKANWWGHPTGPTHADNPDGQGDAVSDNVNFIPWLDAPCPAGKPVGAAANFVGVPREGLAPLTVQFTDLSQGTAGSNIVSWLWQFGDGTESTEQHPTHTYTAVGTYTVTLTVTDDLDQSDTETKPNYINVLEECPLVDVPDPAKLAAFNMLVSPGQVHPNQQIEISINIGNTGGTASTREVNLYINGHFEANQTVTVPAGSTQLVMFTVTRAQPGTYYVSVDGHEGQFTVMGAPATHWGGPIGTGGIIAIIVVVIALVVGLVFVFRRQ